ncbi:hypothetical protein [Stutzerimonas nitrititolerans]|uniref:hypothetical protein n=1 Tax=Stutzerimonas nitrititolerans TaxID=2482751 RepID=UPI0028AFD8DC|nr:hypothetical protein [Stutzerimonas nitrititolerans]
MNPRILKKLSKRVSQHGKTLGYRIEAEVPCNSDYGPQGASRKLSHRDWYRRADGEVCVSGLLTLKGTPWLSWTCDGPDGPDGDSAVAWPFLVERVRGQIDADARDWSADLWATGGVAPFRDGKPPVFPRNTWQMVRAIESEALVSQYRSAIRQQRWRLAEII